LPDGDVSAPPPLQVVLSNVHIRLEDPRGEGECLALGAHFKEFQVDSVKSEETGSQEGVVEKVGMTVSLS
jgi:hypothetical protein